MVVMKTLIYKFAHVSKLIAVIQKVLLVRIYLDGAVDVAAGVLEDVLEGLAASLGLVGNAATNEVALGVGGDLAGDPDLAGGFNGLGLGVCVRFKRPSLTRQLAAACVARVTYVVSHSYENTISESNNYQNIRSNSRWAALWLEICLMSLIVRVWCGVDDWSLWYVKAGTVLWQKSRGVMRS